MKSQIQISFLNELLEVAAQNMFNMWKTKIKTLFSQGLKQDEMLSSFNVSSVWNKFLKELKKFKKLTCLSIT